MVGWHHHLNGHEFEQTLGDEERWMPGVLQSMGSQRVRQDLATEQHQEGKTLFCTWNFCSQNFCCFSPHEKKKGKEKLHVAFFQCEYNLTFPPYAKVLFSCTLLYQLIAFVFLALISSQKDTFIESSRNTHFCKLSWDIGYKDHNWFPKRIAFFAENRILNKMWTRISFSFFKTSKLLSICQQIWKIQQWPQDWKRSVFITIPKKGNPKECSNYWTIALISHASKVMLKILQARLQHTWTENFQMFKLVLEKAEEPEIKLPTSAGSSKNQECSRKTGDLFLLYWLCQSLWLCGWQ